MNEIKRVRRRFCVVGMILVAVYFLLAAAAADRKPQPVVRPMPNLHNPDSIAVFNGSLFFTDKERIFKYSLDDISLVCQFGKRGAGPGEFIPYPQIQNQGDIKVTLLEGKIFVGSRGKMSRFTASGDFIRDQRTADTQALCLTPFGVGYAGFQVIRFPRWRLDFHIYNENGSKDQLLCSIDQPIHLDKSPGKGLKMVFLDLLTCGPEYRIYGGNIYISGRESRAIDVFDSDGNRVNSIDCDFPRVKITESKKGEIWRLYRHNKEDIWQRAKKIITVPDDFPRFRTFQITDNKIYVQTYKRVGQNTEFYVFYLRGDQISKMNVPLLYKNIVTPYPYAIHQGRLITLKENQDTGDWELHLINI